MNLKGNNLKKIVLGLDMMENIDLAMGAKLKVFQNVYVCIKI
jgi:hypothetical protein